MDETDYGGVDATSVLSRLVHSRHDDLAGSAAVITGAASGIGAATARAFAATGVDLILGWTSSDPHEIRNVVDAAERSGVRVHAVDGDVTDTEHCERLVSACLERYGRLDVCVANAGVARRGRTGELGDTEWARLIDVNLGGVFRCFRAALPAMVKARRGRLLATASIAGAVQGWAEHAAYCASKAGVAGLVRALALEVGGVGVTVNAVAPGAIVTPQTLDAVNSRGARGLEAAAPAIPVGRLGTPDDIAAVFCFLASERARFLTGQVIAVDGGATVRMA